MPNTETIRWIQNLIRKNREEQAAKNEFVRETICKLLRNREQQFDICNAAGTRWEDFGDFHELFIMLYSAEREQFRIVMQQDEDGLIKASVCVQNDTELFDLHLRDSLQVAQWLDLIYRSHVDFSNPQEPVFIPRY